MTMGRQTGQQGEMILTWDELPRSPGHVFYDRLQEVLREAGFDAVAEDLCRPYYAAVLGAPSLPPGRYFRMHLVGSFEGIDSERGLEWRCADSLSLRDFLGLGLRQRVPDHSWLSRTRARLPLEVHEQVFAWVLARLAERGLVKGERIGVDASTMAANAAMRSIRRRDTGATYREMLTRMAKASGIATPTAADLKRLDRRRRGKRTPNAEWTSPTDPDARITRLKDGRTRLADKPEHAVDLDTGAIVAAEIHPADRGDTTTLGGTLEAAAQGLQTAGSAPTAAAPSELVADKGDHSRAVVKELADGPWQTRIAEPKPKEVQRWHGDAAARRAVYNNRARLRSAVAKEAFRLRAERVERSFEHTLDRGGLRRTWLRGRENVHKRYLVHVAAYNLGLVMRLLLGAGTPRELAARGGILLWAVDPAVGVAILLILLPGLPPNSTYDPTSSTACYAAFGAPPRRGPRRSGPPGRRVQCRPGRRRGRRCTGRPSRHRQGVAHRRGRDRCQGHDRSCGVAQARDPGARRQVAPDRIRRCRPRRRRRRGDARELLLDRPDLLERHPGIRARADLAGVRRAAPGPDPGPQAR